MLQFNWNKHLFTQTQRVDETNNKHIYTFSDQ